MPSDWQNCPLGFATAFNSVLSFLMTAKNRRSHRGRSDFYVVFTMSLCALELKQNVNKFAISSNTALKLGKQALKSYLKISCEFQLRRPPNNKS